MSSRRPELLLVSLGATGGLRAADAQLAASLRRAGASVREAVASPRRDVRTLALTDLVWALAARHATQRALAEGPADAVIYSSVTAALLAPRPGAIRFDAPAAGNRPGHHGFWQRPLERRRLGAAPLLLPWSEGGLREAELTADALERAVVVPVAVSPSGPAAGPRDVAAVTYAANPHKKGLDRILAAWRAVRRPGEELVVAGASPPLAQDGVRVAGRLEPADYRALLRRARVFVSAARREDHGLAQLEALADGCLLVSTPAPGPYVALAIARELDPRLVSADLGPALRAALDDPLPDYAERAQRALAPLGRERVDEIVAEQVLPRLLAR